MGGMGGGILGKVYDRNKERKDELKMKNTVEKTKQPLSKVTAPKQKTKMNTGVNIGGQY